MKRILFFLLAGIAFSRVEVIEGEGYKYVEVSKKDINRIVCPVKISGVVYSKEKLIQVQVEGKNAYVKFLPVQVGEKLVYKDHPRELYVECGGKVFSLILIPKDIHAKTIVLKVPLKDVKRASKFEAGEYYKVLTKLISYAYRETPPPGYEVKEVNKHYKSFKEGELRILKVYEGVSFSVLELEFVAKERVYLNPAVFVPYFKKPVAVSVVKPSLEKGERTRVFVVVRRDA